MPLPLKSLFSLPVAIRGAEVALAVALALALVDLSGCRRPGPGPGKTRGAGRGGLTRRPCRRRARCPARPRPATCLPRCWACSGGRRAAGRRPRTRRARSRETDLDLTLKGILASRAGGSQAGRGGAGGGHGKGVPGRRPHRRCGDHAYRGAPAHIAAQRRPRGADPGDGGAAPRPFQQLIFPSNNRYLP